MKTTIVVLCGAVQQRIKFVVQTIDVNYQSSFTISLVNKFIGFLSLLISFCFVSHVYVDCHDSSSHPRPALRSPPNSSSVRLLRGFHLRSIPIPRRSITFDYICSMISGSLGVYGRLKDYRVHPGSVPGIQSKYNVCATMAANLGYDLLLSAITTIRVTLIF